MKKRYVVLSHMGDDVTVECSPMTLEDAQNYKAELEERSINLNEDNPTFPNYLNEIYYTIEEVVETYPKCAGKSFIIKEGK